MTVATVEAQLMMTAYTHVDESLSAVKSTSLTLDVLSSKVGSTRPPTKACIRSPENETRRKSGKSNPALQNV